MNQEKWLFQLEDGRDFGDADVWRAARAAAGEIMHGPRPNGASFIEPG
jgi:hypothetical protein